MNDNLLRTSLLDLLHALGSDAQNILLGGGYGLYLKQLHMTRAGERTLIGADVWPGPRATQDLDLMLPAELVADAESMTVLRTVLDNLGYKVIESAKYLQFVRTIADTQVVKIDLLTAQLDVLKRNPAIRADNRRAKPAGSKQLKLHAHPTDGALQLTDAPLVIDVAGALSTGLSFTAPVRIPHPFNYLLMKLTAYRDRRQDPNKDLGRHHALDVFRIIAMLTEPELDHVKANLKHFAEDTQVRSCIDVVRSDFSGSTTPGVLTLRSHPLWRNDQQLPEFFDLLQAITT